MEKPKNGLVNEDNDELCGVTEAIFYYLVFLNYMTPSVLLSSVFFMNKSLVTQTASL